MKAGLRLLLKRRCGLRPMHERVLNHYRNPKGVEAPFAPELRSALSRGHQLRKSTVPTVVHHGTPDKTVPFEPAERFTRLMKESGNECVPVRFDGKGRGFRNATAFRPLEMTTISTNGTL